MTPEEHDRIFASVSHLPHVLAYALVDMIAKEPSAHVKLKLAGAGFRDFTRIAASSPVMWRDICISNRDAISEELRSYRKELDALQKYIDEGNPIPDVSDIWNEIEKAISEYSPDFKARIMILCRGSISTNEYRTAMLIKCGLSLTHMAILLGRSKSSISGRRDSLCVKMFDKKLTSSVIEQRVRIM